MIMGRVIDMKNQFGMFIHWGIYAVSGVQEQVLARNNMTHAEYDRLAAQFNPLRYDPEQWVLAAKQAGMKYICFTTKHHDGFCMWDTKYTDYNVMNTPYGKDVLKQLADACHKHGMLLSLYYSNPDWHQKDAYNPYSSHMWKAVNKNDYSLPKYRAYIKNQLTELLTGYGKIYTFFWDIRPRYQVPEMNAYIRSLQPGILINNRGYDAGDFSTPERVVPEGKRFSSMTEGCQSVGEQSWGYRSNEDYYSARFLMSSIDKIMAMGGSYLLNVGPKADGTIPEQALRLLKEIGRWYNSLGGTLEETEPDTFPYETNVPYPYIAVQKDGKSYFHFYEGIHSSAVTFYACPSVPKSARLLNSGARLPIRYERLPACIADDGTSMGPYVSLTDIPVEDFPKEPIVIEVEW